MNQLKSLNGKILRSRIDGANFTALVPFNPNDFTERTIKIDNLENSTDAYNFSTLINYYKNQILKAFNLNENVVNNTSSGIKIIETNNIGIFCELKRKKYDLFIHIQFKGFFFIQDNALHKMRLFITELIDRTKTIFRLTLIDIAKDILLKPSEILPYDSKVITENNYHYHFSHKKYVYTDQVKNELIETGFRLQNSRFTIKVYDKRHENSQHKNQIKKEYYEQYFSKYVDTNGQPFPVTRVELTVKQEACVKFSDHALNDDVTEDVLINNILSSFSKKHSLKQRSESSSDKDIKRWPIVQNWIDLFSSNNDVELKDKTPSDHRYSNPRINIESLLEKLVEAFAFKTDYDFETLSEEDVLSLIRPKIKDILQNAKTKRYEHEKTQRDHEDYVRQIAKRRNNKQLSFGIGDFL